MVSVGPGRNARREEWNPDSFRPVLEKGRELIEGDWTTSPHPTPVRPVILNERFVELSTSGISSIRIRNRPVYTEVSRGGTMAESLQGRLFPRMQMAMQCQISEYGDTIEGITRDIS